MPEHRGDIGLNSLLHYVDSLVCRAAPRAGRARLGARWGFWHPDPDEALWEFSLPSGPEGMVTKLGERTGIRIQRRSGIEALRATLDVTPAICAVNSFHLPYRPAFARVHSHRTVLLERADADRVWVVDDWPPVHRGWVRWATLEEASQCEVPLVPEREPIFAGGTLDAFWWTVETLPLAVRDARAWAWSLLESVSGTFAGAADGASAVEEAMACFAREVREATSPLDRRRQALTLRAEVGSRAFLAHLLRAAASWTAQPALAECAASLVAAAAELQRCRDLLTKLTRLDHPTYPDLLQDYLRQAIVGETSAHRSLSLCISQGRSRDASYAS